MSVMPWNLDTAQDFTGAIRFLSVAPEAGSPDIALVCFVRARIDAAATVVVDRLANGKVDTANGRLQIAEVTDSGIDVLTTVTTGTATFNPKKAGTIQRGYRIWEFLVRSSPGGVGSITFRVSAGLPPAIAVRELDETGPVTAGSNMLNTATPAKVVFATKKIPRLSEGINKAEPEPAPDKYRGFARGSGDPNSLPSDRKSANIVALLHQVYFQLDAPHTFDAAWDVTGGTESWVELSNSAFTVSPIVVAEEHWARQVTEMLLLAVYAAPSAPYEKGLSDTKLSLSSFLDASNPYYGLGYRCQELATFGVASRGIDLKGRILGAGANSAAVVLSSVPAGKWYVGTSGPAPKPDAKSGRPHDLMDGPSEMDLLPLLKSVAEYGPGSIHLFSNQKPDPDGPISGTKTYDELVALFNAGTPVAGRATKIGTAMHPVRKKDCPAQLIVTVAPNKDKKPGSAPFTKTHHDPIFLYPDLLYAEDNQPVGAHIGFAVRVRHDQNKVQFVDTGALNVANSTSDIVENQGGFQDKIYDTAATTRVKSITHLPYKGTGVFPPIDAAGAAKLKDTVQTLAKARPIGLARFALLDRSKAAVITASSAKKLLTSNAIIYVSALLPMWGPEEMQNYHISRYLWSLRTMPNASALEAVWMLYTPLGKFAQALASASRSQKVLDIAKSVAKNIDFPRELAAMVRPLQDLVITDKGLVQTKGASISGRHALHALEGRSPTGKIELPLNSQFPDPTIVSPSELPEYFRG